MAHMGSEPPKRRRKPMWTQLRLAYYFFAVIGEGAWATYWLIQLIQLVNRRA